MPHHGESSHLWYCLLEKLDAFPVQFARDDREPGQIPTRMRKACREPCRDGITDDKHDGQRGRRVLRRHRCRHAYSHQRVELELHELGGKIVKTFDRPRA